LASNFTGKLSNHINCSREVEIWTSSQISDLSMSRYLGDKRASKLTSRNESYLPKSTFWLFNYKNWFLLAIQTWRITSEVIKR